MAFAPPISADLVPFIFAPKVGLALIMVTGVDIANEAPTVESGIVHVQVLESFRPAEPRSGAPVTFPFAREADPRTRLLNGANTWNVLRLEPGARLLVAWTPVDARNGSYSLVAALDVEQSGPPEVAELKESVAIQSLPPSNPARKQRLANGLVAGKSILRRYASTAVGPQQFVPRAEGVAMLKEAIVSERTDADDDLALANALVEPPLFDADKGDDEPNRIVLTTLASELISADSEHSSLWLRYLYSRVMAELSDDADEDARRRRELLRAIGVAENALSEKLRRLIAEAGPDLELATELLGAWQGSQQN